MCSYVDEIRNLTMTSRIEVLRERIAQESWKQKEWFSTENETVLNEKNAREPLVIRKALAFSRMLDIIPIAIRPGELVVGDIPLNSVAGGRPFISYATTAEEEAAAKQGLSIRSVWGHICPNYFNSLRLGLTGVRAEVKRCLIQEREADYPDAEKLAFYAAGEICCQGVAHYMERYRVLAEEQAAAETDPERKDELLRLEQICRALQERAPESFYEAVQLYYFFHCAMHANGNFSTLGRFDQQLWPFLERELERGSTTIAQAQEILECVWLKFNERTQKNTKTQVCRANPSDWSTGRDPSQPVTFNLYEDTAYFNQWYQTVAIGGRDRQGRNAVNPLSYMCLMASRHIRMTQPGLYARVGSDCPESFLALCCELIADGLGAPTLVSDDAKVNSLLRAGIAPEDANNYSFAGCWEPIPAGACNFQWTPIHALKALELVLFRGMDQLTGRMAGVDTGDPDRFASMKELMEATKIQLRQLVDNAVKNALRYENAMYRIAPIPFMSILMDGCLESGKDITNGGAKYSLHALSVTGVPNTADALTAIDQLVFRQKRFTLSQFADILAKDYEGQEQLRLEILNKLPKFGNDVDEVDRLAVELVDSFYADCRPHAERYPNSNIWFLAMVGTTPMFKLFGRAHAASPDGRKSGTPIANNMSPVDGQARSGVTAIIESHVKPDYSRAPMGSELNLHFQKKSLRTREGMLRMRAVIDTYFEKGGGGLNITVADVETLLAAQKDPEHHQDLMVRLGGWQAYFVALDKVHQDALIARDKF